MVFAISRARINVPAISKSRWGMPCQAPKLALLWIANAESSVDKQEKLLADVMELMRPLLPSSLR
jgi:hypothetical protein